MISPEHLVAAFLRGQNLEQIGKIDEAILLYEESVTAEFDAAGPYDRLILIYEAQRRDEDVIRVAKACLKNVRSWPSKRDWYAKMMSAANGRL